MNAESSDFDRALRTWFEEGPTVMADRVVESVADRIARQPQRRTWRLRGRPFMNTYFKLAAGIAAVVIVAVVGYNLLPRQPGGSGGPTSSPTEGPTVAPSETAMSSAVLIPEGPVTASRYLFQPSTQEPSLSIVADIPSGWVGVPPWAVVGPGGTEPPGGLGLAFLHPRGLYSDPCHWDDGTGSEDQPGDVEVGPTANDLVEALQANTSYTTSEATPVTFPEFQGSREFQGFELDIQLPADLELEMCDSFPGESGGSYFVFSGFDGSLFAQGNGNRWHTFIVDVDGTRVVVVGAYYEGTPLADQQAFRGIIESLEFTP